MNAEFDVRLRCCCAVISCCLCGLALATAGANPTEFHRQLLASWKPIENGFTYEMTVAREPLVIAKTTGEGMQRQVVAFEPAPPGRGSVERLRVTAAGETLHVVRIDGPHRTGVLLRGDTIHPLDSQGRSLGRLERDTFSEFQSISSWGFLFTPSHMGRHWLGEPWPLAWVPPGGRQPTPSRRSLPRNRGSACSR